MNKLFKTSLIVVFILALAVTAFANLQIASDLAAGQVCPSVGWNTGPAQCGFDLSSPGSMDGVAFQGPIYRPSVGWNT